MIFHPDLFLTESIKKDYKRIMYRLKHENKKENVFLVTLSTDCSGIFDIIDYRSLFLSVGDCDCLKDLIVIGLGSDYDDAKQLTLSIVASFYASDVSCDIRDYFMNRLNSYDKVS